MKKENFPFRKDRKVHKFDFDDVDYLGVPYGYLVCLNPETFHEPGRRYQSSNDWSKVTCKHCLKKR